ncbi:hypothetical protein NRIC_04020 [Enterococcus florum]|uniref:Uncharacterized protein n=1 Tax=Enterococcus florum TaxID=2480627 RepID=A0A4P5P8G6_9ENTE|nr:hypothetical protein [Enterococcus florum]GCF92511.1 hypothetical protein NRIC_04020 [Enterococcus florum]
MKRDKVFERLAAHALARKEENQQQSLQRRNQVVDLFGIEHKSQGDSAHPATFYISITPDLIYLERFEFKIIISPFAMPIGGRGATGMASIAVTESANGTHTVNPNPHNHTLDAGVTLVSSSVQNVRLKIAGIDMTDAFKKQYPNNWIDGEGVFPNEGFENFDVLKAVEHLWDWQRGVVLSPGYKKVELFATGTFNATLVNYLKYSHTNR